MKKIAFFIAVLSHMIVNGQQNDCEWNVPFNKMPNHSISKCETKEFETMKIHEMENGDGYKTYEKSGEFMEVQYNFDGDWSKRPSPVQIYQNYINAVEKAGGKVLHKSESQLHLFLKKVNDRYWVNVSTDGSGMYFLRTIKEGGMKQDIEITAEQISRNITEEGKAAFYGIYFETDQAVLKSRSSKSIAEIAKYLKANPGVAVYIVGHTDNAGNYEHNIKLSLERAQAVMNELANVHSITKERLQAAGIGPLSPVSINTSEAGKAMNRRVEVVLK